jgi:hypothetical protein
VREALKLDQEARDREVKSRQIAKTYALAKEKAEKELTAKKAREAVAREAAIKKSRQAEEARRAEAQRKAESDRLSWREVSPHGVTPKKKAGPYHWPRAVGMRRQTRSKATRTGQTQSPRTLEQTPAPAAAATVKPGRYLEPVPQREQEPVQTQVK